MELECLDCFPLRERLKSIETSAMTIKLPFLFFGLMNVTTAVVSAPLPPDIAKHAHAIKAPFGAIRNDNYYWLRDDTRTNKVVLSYLNAENAYADKVLEPLKPLQQTLYKEIVARIKKDDASVPYRKHGWFYYSRFESGKDYPIHARRKDGSGLDAAVILAANASGDFAGEQVLLDVNALAAGKSYFSVAHAEVSPNTHLLAWAEDGVGRRQYTVRFKNLETGVLYQDEIHGASSSVVWADDNKTLFYIENDPKTLLTKRVKKHVLGTPVSTDVVVYEEHDDSFYMDIERTRDEKYIVVSMESTVSSEMRYAPADLSKGFVVLARRERDVKYGGDHFDSRWVIRTNADGAKNYKLVTAPSDATLRSQWRDLVVHDPAVFIEDFELFDGFTAIQERSQGLERVRLLKADGQHTDVAADEPAYSMGLSENPEPDNPWLRYTYTSLTTPATTYEFNVRTGERRQLKQQPVIGYDPSQYVTERLWVTARDGVKVPVSLVYRKGFKKDGTAALYQYAYGSYGLSTDPGFNLPVASLLDRGVVYAIAHIRGGQEMGRQWYDDGKLLHKQNTFNDFIDVTRELVAQGYAAKGRVAAAGGSAGGLLMGVVANQAPSDYRVIVAQVPFVDVVTTMLDPSIPLTTNEYDEWGNPEQKTYYDYMLTYSPYDNVVHQAYPALFVGTGLWDSQVQYWEPAKWVAKLRDENTGTFPIVFRVNMDAGHGGKSGRFRRYQELAESYAFVLHHLEVK
ncbi:oligopeptidase B Serine peptidase. MEROPS family S09A [Xylella fastidiosa]|jgi:oligopeptidase B|nr:peptidase [Xylella fastidiosa subsp. fastidiosa Mus-1]SHG32720.1 oligopeptidase B Serine peptidase. MEROPS family S09A [Xylella fastidiosa]